ncbi:MAG: MerR family transcriptional regulator [Holophagaceae bacterium]|nr:MerR family transcriptional regulator [Holophagaceae bacterium]
MSERIWFKIGEAAEYVGVSAREIRYWERKIPEIHPRRSKGNLRHYHKDDLPKLRGIATWIKNGYTVAECRELLIHGSITRDLGLYTDEPEQSASSPNHTTIMSSPAIGHRPDTCVGLPSETVGHTIERMKLSEIIDSVKALLVRLQNPIP